MKKKILLGIVALALVIGVAVYASTRPEPPDTRFTGAYALADGTLVFVTPREGKILRYRQMNGESAVLWPIREGEYEGGAGWDQREPVINHFKFASRPVRPAWLRLATRRRQSRAGAPDRSARTHGDVSERRSAIARQAGDARGVDARLRSVPCSHHRARLGVVQRGRSLLRALHVRRERLRRARLRQARDRASRKANTCRTSTCSRTTSSQRSAGCARSPGSTAIAFTLPASARAAGSRRSRR